MFFTILLNLVYKYLDVGGWLWEGFEPIVAENNFSNGSDVDLFYVKKEYQKLYDDYQIGVTNQKLFLSEISRLKHELENKCVLEEKLANLEDIKHKNVVQNDALLKDLNEYKTKYNKKCVEFKSLKDEIDTVRKENNSASVALKRSQKEQQETVKKYEKKIQENENKIGELIEYKKKKMNEERDLKLKQKKEIKKSKQLAKKEAKDLIEDIATTSDPNENDLYPDASFSNPLIALSLSSPTRTATVTTSSSSNSMTTSTKSPASESQPSASGPSLESSSDLSLLSSSNSNNSTHNISKDQTSLFNEEFKTEVTQMIGKYRENQDCSISWIST